jgi:RNA polymerase sigma-70 factor (ECF subfamily)
MSRILQAFTENRDALRRRIGRFIHRSADVEDLLQDVFLRAYAAEARQHIDHPKAYLFRAARNIALNELASRKTRSVRSVEDFDDPDVIGSDMQPGVEQQVAARQRLGLFARALDSLPEQCRRVMVLRKVEGMSQREISQTLGIAESTVEKHLIKGMILTREFMARAEASPDPSNGPMVLRRGGKS